MTELPTTTLYVTEVVGSALEARGQTLRPHLGVIAHAADVAGLPYREQTDTGGIGDGPGQAHYIPLNAIVQVSPDDQGPVRPLDPDQEFYEEVTVRDMIPQVHGLSLGETPRMARERDEGLRQIIRFAQGLVQDEVGEGQIADIPQVPTNTMDALKVLLGDAITIAVPLDVTTELSPTDITDAFIRAMQTSQENPSMSFRSGLRRGIPFALKAAGIVPVTVFPYAYLTGIDWFYYSGAAVCGLGLSAAAYYRSAEWIGSCIDTVQRNKGVKRIVSSGPPPLEIVAVNHDN